MLGQVLQKYKTLLIIVGVIVVVFFGFRMFSSDTPSEGLTSEPVAGVIPEEGGDLITLLLELKSITLDTSILQDPTFLTLQDFSVDIAPEPIGRPNPFAPIGVVSAPATTTAEE